MAKSYDTPAGSKYIIWGLVQDNQSATYCILLYAPYGPVRAFIAKVLRKSLYEGRTWWREQVRKKPSGPARITFGPHTGILSIARARCKLKQLFCYINPNFAVKMSNIPKKNSVVAHGPLYAWSVRHDLGPNIFPSGPPTQAIST